jgi:hypothetical protein
MSQGSDWKGGEDGWVVEDSAGEKGGLNEEEFYQDPKPLHQNEFTYGVAQEPPPNSSLQPTNDWGNPQREPANRFEYDVESGRTLALLSHLGIIFGLPLFIIPLITRDNALSLHHAKAAAANFIFMMIAAVVTFVTCGLGFPLLFLPWVFAIVGMVNASGGKEAGPWGLGTLGESVFKIDVK